MDQISTSPLVRSTVEPGGSLPVSYRSVYGRRELRRLIEPQSIAIAGISATIGSFGQRTRANLGHYGGRIYGVNPKYKEVHGISCFSRLTDLPESPDLVVVAVPRERVEDVLEDGIAAKAGGVIVYASGFAETGRPERIAQQNGIVARARAAGLPLVGPNCIGMINNLSRAGAIFQANYDKTPHLPSGVGIVSQSGAIGYTMVQASERGGGFSHYFTTGNSGDVDVCDFVSYLVEVPDCRAIVCLFEGLPDGRRLIEAGEKARAAGKPIVAYKMTCGEASAVAALTHTGNLAGSDAAYAAAFERTGIIAVDDLDIAYETASFLAKTPHPIARGVAAIVTSGGAGVIAAERAEHYGLPMPQPGPAAQGVLDARIPEFGAKRNPADITAQVLTDPESFTACFRAMIEDPAYGAAILPVVTAVPEITPKRHLALAELAKTAEKPICLVWMTAWLQGPGSDIVERDPRLVMFRSMDRCMRALSLWHKWADVVATPRVETPRLTGAAEQAKARELFAAAGDKLSEREAKAILATYGVPVPLERTVRSAAEASAAADMLGYPVAVKIESPDIAHKTETGVVRLGLRDGVAVGRAFGEVMDAAARIAVGPRIDGVSVQRMAPAGVELVVGAKIDPQFGPLVVVGSGGILVELLKDSVAALAPIGVAEALDLLKRLKGYRLLAGFRGSPAVALERVAELIVRVSEFAADHASQVAEIDINPVICDAQGAVAVDALIVRSR